MPGLEEALRHLLAHAPEPDESDLHAVFLSSD
jgi:hypothetical protein